MFHGKLLNRKINGNKKLKSLEDFKNKIRRWELDECHIKLCKDFVSKLGYVNLVGVLDIGLTVRIRIYGLIGSARKVLISVFACSRLTWGDRSGMCNMYRVNNDGNRAMSLMSPWYLYCWLWAYLTVSCVSFIGFQRLFADCLDMPLLPFLLLMFLLLLCKKIHFLSGVNIVFTLI